MGRAALRPHCSRYTPLRRTAHSHDTCRIIIYFSHAPIPGKHLIADSTGAVCTRKEIESDGCCRLSISPRNSCNSCQSELQCCTDYEFCISCCMGGALADLLLFNFAILRVKLTRGAPFCGLLNINKKAAKSPSIVHVDLTTNRQVTPICLRNVQSHVGRRRE